MNEEAREVRMKLFIGPVGIDLTGPIVWVEKTIKRFIRMYEVSTGTDIHLPEDYKWGEQANKESGEN